MTRNKKKYIRLPGLYRSTFRGNYTLWLGSDHLLLINYRIGSEDYKRFYYRDIQAIYCHTTKRGIVYSLLIGVWTILFGSVTFLADQTELYVFATLTLLCFLILIVNIIKGQTCRTFIQTAVQTEKLPSLNRFKLAQKALKKIEPHIEKVQGRLTTDTISESYERLAQEVFRGGSRLRSKLSLHYRGPIHLVLFISLIVEGLGNIVFVYYNNLPLLGVNTASGLVVGVCIIIALVRQSDYTVEGTIRRLVWVGLAYTLVNFIAGYILFIIFSVLHPAVPYDQWSLIKRIAAQSPLEYPAYTIFLFVMAGLALVIGFLGMYYLWGTRQMNESSPNM